MRALVMYLPPHAAADPEMRAIQDALTPVMAACWEAWESFLAQLFPQTATWSMPDWERLYNVFGASGNALAQRREVVLAKMRSAATATPELLRNIAGAWADGEVEITEYPSEYRFVIKFVSQYGLPENIADLQAAIDAAKPAHLSVSYETRYLFIYEVEAMTLEELETIRLENFAGGS